MGQLGSGQLGGSRPTHSHSTARTSSLTPWRTRPTTGERWFSSDTASPRGISTSMIMSGRCPREAASDAEAIGRFLSERSLRPDLVYCSTATRTRQTWECAMAGGATAGEVQYRREIYQAWVPELVKLIRTAPAEINTMLVLGHAPGIPDPSWSLVCVLHRIKGLEAAGQQVPHQRVCPGGRTGALERARQSARRAGQFRGSTRIEPLNSQLH